MRQILLSLTLLLALVHTSLAEVKTVQRLDLQRYLGTWYEAARFPARFQRGCEDSKAIYAKLDDNQISVTNSCIRDGKKTVAKGNAIVRGPGMLAVKFSIFMPFRAPYWVLWVDDNYQTAVVGEPNRKFGWILVRDSNRSRSSLETAVKVFEKNGYDTSQLVWDNAE